jgi:PAS domain S-box-containing protein
LANPTLVRMLGYESLEDLIRRNLEEDGFEAGYPRTGFKEQIEAEGEIRGLESAWKRRDGTPVFVRESAKAIRDAAGNVLYYEGTVEDISDRRKAEDALRASLREKEVLLREIHHRVKNNMQIISSLLSLQAREIDDPAIVEMFRESQSRIRSMAFVHEKLYQSKDLSRIGFSDYIRSLTNHLTQTYIIDGERIRFESEIEDIALDIGTAIPCGLIINELVTNAFKHAFPDVRAGTVRLELRRAAEDRFLLRVADDGVGFPAGLDFQLTESLGMQLVLMLVDQINGAIELEPGPGTSFRIDFGEVKYKTKY